MKKQSAFVIIIATIIFSVSCVSSVYAKIKIGLNYPKTGPYAVQGLDQLRAAQMAVDEINAGGGILGEQIELAIRDSQSKTDVTKANVTELIEKEGVKMVFGGSSSGVAIAAGDICQEKGVLFFGTLTYSTATTGPNGHRHTFRECYDSWMAAKALGSYLNENFKGGKYFYITADYTWGWTTEESFRKLTNTLDTSKHPQVKTKFPGAQEADFRAALEQAKKVEPDVLVLVLFGYDMSTAAKLATEMGLKEMTQIVVPNITLGMAESAGPEVMEGIIGALPWCWNVPYSYNYAKGKEFIEKYSAKHSRYPSTSGASAYTILHEYKAAVERAKSFESAKVIKALEGHEYQLLKDPQIWRDFDHQSVQTVYAVKCKPAALVKQDKYGLDYFKILSKTLGSEAAISQSEWITARQKAQKAAQLEPLP
ncbi:MAG: substrate-binding protein [bacterium]